MALDSNGMCDRDGTPLPRFSPYPTPASCGVSLLPQELSEESAFLARPYLDSTRKQEERVKKVVFEVRKF